VESHGLAYFEGAGPKRQVVSFGGTIQDITERKEREEKELLLMREIKNMLSVVDAIAHQTAAKNPEDFVERFSERVQALSANQDLLVRNEWNGVDVADLVRAQLAHFADLVGSRVAVRGPKLRLNAASAQAIGLALHELATNAGKYGSLSTDRGCVDIRWGTTGDTFTMAEARFRLIIGLIRAVMAALLYAEFGVLRQVLLILGVVPLATLGGLMALDLTGTTLNVASGVGFIALFGVAVLNGVIMVANLNRHRDMCRSMEEAVLSGASERLRPVLMTACVATVGMLPASLATGVGSDVQRGVATVVAGGLLIATLLTLFVIPTFYFVLERRELRRIRGIATRAAAS
jgi:hypothetical protein